MSINPESGRLRDAPVAIVPLARPAVLSTPPYPLTPLIGREREVAAALALVREDGARLVTLTGPGGIGKTRLALQVAASLKDDFASAVVWVPLATVSDAHDVLPAIARALGIGESLALDPLASLRAMVRDAPLLLVLDNFEQLLAAGGHISALLASCPALVALVTSRSLLRLSGEHVLTVPPLPLPAAQERASLDRLAQSGAVQLFVSGARSVSPAFTLDTRSAPLVGDICRQLDGIPLAIELAAARVNHLPLAALRGRLEPRLPLLTSGVRDRPARHRTMRDAIAWSYDLLTPDEQAVFRQLAICNGGCRLNAVAALGGVGPATGDVAAHDNAGGNASLDLDLLDVVAGLVGHSLLREETDPDGEPRYVMLETIREFGLDRLTHGGEREAVEHRRADWALELAARSEHAAFLPDGDRMLALLAADHGNLQEALAWLDATGETRDLLRLAGSLAISWYALGYYREGQHWLERALNRSTGQAGADRARALTGLAIIATYQSDVSRAESLYQQVLALLPVAGEPLQRALALLGLGVLHNQQASYERAAASLAEALRLSRAIDPPALAAFVAGTAHANLGVTLRGQGDLSGAAVEHEQALALRRAAGYTLGISRTVGDLGDVARDRGDHALALAYYRESLSLPLAHMDRRVIADILAGAAPIALAWGQPERSARLLGAAATLREAIGTTISGAAERAASDRATTVARAALSEDAFTAAWTAGRSLSIEQAIAEVAAITPPAGTGAQPSAAATRYGLTPRERDVFRGLAEHLTDREIAERLFLSPRTVGWHVTSILSKLGVDSRRAAAAKARQERLLDPELAPPGDSDQ